MKPLLVFLMISFASSSFAGVGHTFVLTGEVPGSDASFSGSIVEPVMGFRGEVSHHTIILGDPGNIGGIDYSWNAFTIQVLTHGHYVGDPYTFGDEFFEHWSELAGDPDSVGFELNDGDVLTFADPTGTALGPYPVKPNKHSKDWDVLPDLSLFPDVSMYVSKFSPVLKGGGTPGNILNLGIVVPHTSGPAALLPFLAGLVVSRRKRRC